MVDSRRALQGTLVGLGAVPFVTGLASLARGTSVVRDAPPPHPNVDSEHRFFAVWWTAVGPLLWSVVPDVERRHRAVRGVAATLFAGGVVRVVSARQVGAPHRLYRALGAAELALPPLVVAWQESVRRRAAAPSPPSREPSR